MGARYINVDRDTPMLLPCDMKEWVESTDLVHFVVEALSEVQLPGSGERTRRGQRTVSARDDAGAFSL